MGDTDRCGRCGCSPAHFTGSSKPWGPDESDCSNTPENLPGGHAYLCDNCDYELWVEACHAQAAEQEEIEKRRQVAKVLLKEYRRHTHFPICYPAKVARMSAYFRACKSVDAFQHVSQKYWHYWRSR